MSSNINLHYATLDIVKQKLRLPEDDHLIDAELETYATEIDQMIDRHLRRKLGRFDQNGDPITLPLTETTYPIITEDLRVCADDLLEGKFRLKTTNDDLLWNNAKQTFQEYLDIEFGWTENKKFRRTSSITISPTNGVVSTVVTITGIDYANVENIEITFDGALVTPTPDPLVSTATGTVSGTFVVPSNAAKGSKEIKVRSVSHPTSTNVTVLSNVSLSRFEVT